MATFGDVRRRLQTEQQENSGAFGAIRNRFNQPEEPKPVDTPIRVQQPTPQLADVMAERGYRQPQEISMPNNILPSQTITKSLEQRAQDLPNPSPAAGQRLIDVPANFLEGAYDSIGFGLLGEAQRRINNILTSQGLMTQDEANEIETNQQARQETGAYRVGQIAGYIPPGAAIERAVATVARPFIQNLPRAGRLATTGAAAGAIEAAAQEGADVAFRGETFDPANVAIGTAAGGVIGGATPLVERGLQRLLQTFRPQQATPQGPTLALPEPRQRGNANAAQTPDVINASGRVEPIGLPEPNVAPPTRARVERQTNPYRERLEAFSESMQGVELPPGREREVFWESWGRFARPDEPDLETMIDLAYSSSAQTSRRPVSFDLVRRARETQRRREAYGVGMPVRSMSDRYQGGVLGRAAMPETVIARNNMQSPLRQQSENIRPQSNLQTPLRQQEVIDIQPSPIQEVEEAIQAVQQPRVRDRVYSYLDEAERAARERISGRRNRLSANPVDEWADYAIVMAAKLGKGTIKAADFTEELVKEFGEQIRPHADRIFRQTREVLKQQERRASKEGQEALKFNNSGKGDADSFEAKISRDVQ